MMTFKGKSFEQLPFNIEPLIPNITQTDIDRFDRAIRDWKNEKNMMEGIVGPMGFSNMGFSNMLSFSSSVSTRRICSRYDPYCASCQGNYCGHYR